MRSFLLLCILLALPVFVFPFSYFKTIDGKRYFGNIKKKTSEYLLVELEDEDRVIKIFKKDLVLMEDEELGLEIYKPDYLNPVDSNTATLPFYTNNIYVPMNSTKIVQRAGSGTLKMLMVEDSETWNVVDTEEEAHYIMKYVFDDRGSDKAYLEVVDRNGKKIYTSSKVPARDWVPWHAGEESATKLYEKLLKNVKKGRL